MNFKQKAAYAGLYGCLIGGMTLVCSVAMGGISKLVNKLK